MSDLWYLFENSSYIHSYTYQRTRDFCIFPEIHFLIDGAFRFVLDHGKKIYCVNDNVAFLPLLTGF